jgi:hypothetical protein
MLLNLRRHLTYANVVSSLCLFVLLGGSAFAAAKIGSGQIKDNSIKSKDIKNNTVAGKDVHNGSLTAGDFKAGQLPAGSTGATGATGPRGFTGAPGATGSPAASFLTGRYPFPVVGTNPGSNFIAPLGTSTGLGPEAGVSTLSPARAVVARDLAVDAQGSHPGVALITTLSVNGVDTALTCSIVNPVSKCTDTTHAVTIPAGSSIALHITYNVSGGTGSVPDVKFGWRATTP